MSGQPQQDWPNRNVEILGSTVPVCVLSIVVLVWRVAYGIHTKRRLLLGDYLLILAAAMNIATTVIRFYTVEYGLGRHFQDPKIQIRKFSYYLWIGQVVNVLAVAVLKYSICAYLLALKFSKIYLGIVWASILMVSVFNLLIPGISFFSCTPFESNWNKGMKGKCLMTGTSPLVYTQGISNIITDVVYVVAPIIYLSTIKLQRRTQWGLRVVFCLGLLATVCSIMKTTEFSALQKTRDPSWDGVNLTIWSATELSVGVLIAALPPLRKQFDKFFRYLLPTTLGGTRSKSKQTSGVQMYNVSKLASSKPTRGRDADDDSERGILPDQEGRDGITKTVVHEVVSERAVSRDRVQVPMRTSTYGKIES